MLKFIATDVVVSKGYDDKPALRYSEDGSSVRFRIGKRVYDKREEENHRWLNINVKAFGDLCERIKKMKLDAGSFIHLEGRYDEDVWDDENGKTMRMPVVILTDIEYSYSGNGNKQNGNAPADESSAASQNSPQNPSDVQTSQQDDSGAVAQQNMPGNFTGFEGFGGPNPFYPQG